jgi:hypothetical protein
MNWQRGKLGYLACFGLALVAVPFVFSQLNQSATPALATTPTTTHVAKPLPAVPAADTVYVTRTGAKYHRQDCRWAKDAIPLPLAQAAEKYRPCSVCAPPRLPKADPPRALANQDVPFTPPLVAIQPVVAETPPPAPAAVKPTPPVVAAAVSPPVVATPPAPPVVTAPTPTPTVAPLVPLLPPVVVHEVQPLQPLTLPAASPALLATPAPVSAAAKPAASCPCSGSSHSYTYSRGLFRRR